jgi:hypothetical protein
MFGIAQRRGDFAAQLADAALDAIRQRRALFVGQDCVVPRTSFAWLRAIGAPVSLQV